MSKKRKVACVFVNPPGVGKREICFDAKTKKITSNRAEREVVTRGSFKVRVAKLVASGQARRPTAAEKLGPAKCRPLQVGQVLTGSPSWDASEVTRFRVAKLTDKTALLEHVSGYNPLRGGKTVRAKLLGCGKWSGGRSEVFLNPAGGVNTGLVLGGTR